MRIISLVIMVATYALANAQGATKIYLVGDAGEPYFRGSDIQILLKKQLSNSSQSDIIIFLGDNIYPKGLPGINEENREQGQGILEGQLDVLDEFEGRTIFLPGNHDWAKGKEAGLDRIIEQEKYTEGKLEGDVFLPSGGCPGPVSFEVKKDLLLIVYDSQWLLHPYRKSTKKVGCVNSERVEVIESIKNLVKENTDKIILLAAHHPFVTYGIHGGVTTFKDHIFPLTVISPALYLPLPIIGSIYPLARKAGNIQDTNHKLYKSIINELHPIFKEHGRVIHAAGHEHSLQHNLKEGVNYIVSGAGVKTTHVKKKGFSLFAEDEIGFAILNLKNSEIRLEFFNAENSGGKAIYTTDLFELFGK